MTRLRYKKDTNGNLVSKPILVGSNVVIVTLYLSKNSFCISSCDNTNTFNIEQIVSNKSSFSLKRHAKKTLVELGAEFFDEVRTKRL